MHFFLRGAEGALFPAVGHLSAGGDLVACDEEDCICSFGLAEFALCKAVEVVAVRAFPYFAVWSACECREFFGFAG